MKSNSIIKNSILSLLFTIPALNIFLSKNPSSMYIFEIFLIYFLFILIPLLFMNKNLSESGGLIDISFWAFIYVFFGVAFITQLSNLELPWIEIQSYSNHLLKAISLIFLGCFTFTIGRYSNLRFRFTKRRLSLERIDKLFLFSLGIATLIFIIIGFEKMIFPRALFIYTVQNHPLRVIIDLLLVMINTSFFVCLISYLEFYKKEKLSLVKWYFFLFIMFLIFNPLRTERLIVLMYISVLFLYKLKNDNVSWMTAITLGLVLIFPFTDFFRGEAIFVSGIFGESYVGYIDNILDGDFDPAASLLLSIEYVSDKSIMYGENILLAIFGFIPRSIWISKPSQSGYVLTEHANLYFQNIGVNLWAEFYLAFGILGIAILFYIMGILVKNITASRNKSEFFYVLYIYLAVFFIFFLRGDILQVFFKTAPFILFLLFVTRKEREEIVSSFPK